MKKIINFLYIIFINGLIKKFFGRLCWKQKENIDKMVKTKYNL